MNDPNTTLKDWFEQEGYPTEAAEIAAGNIGHVVAAAPPDTGLAASYWQQCLEVLIRAAAAEGHKVDFDAFADAVERFGYMTSEVRELIRGIQPPGRDA
jgi:hypothetical protein